MKISQMSLVPIFNKNQNEYENRVDRATVQNDQILSRITAFSFSSKVLYWSLLKLDRPRLKRGVGELLFTQLKRALCQIVLKLRAVILQSPEPL